MQIALKEICAKSSPRGDFGDLDEPLKVAFICLGVHLLLCLGFAGAVDTMGSLRFVCAAVFALFSFSLHGRRVY